MSSTNRGNERDFHISDYYATPQKTIREMFEGLPYPIQLKLKSPNQVILDPCAGGNSENERVYQTEMSYPYFLQGIVDPSSPIVTMDIRNDSFAEYRKDFLKSNIDIKPDIIISNPPFSHAIEFILKSLEVVNDDGYVIFLLRLNFFGSKGRKEFFDKYMPTYCLVHSERCKFLSNMKDRHLAKQTDSIEYAHFIWKKNSYPSYTQLKTI